MREQRRDESGAQQGSTLEITLISKVQSFLFIGGGSIKYYYYHLWM